MIIEADDGPDDISEVDEPTGAAMKPEVMTPERLSEIETRASRPRGNDIPALCATIRELWGTLELTRRRLVATGYVPGHPILESLEKALPTPPQAERPEEGKGK